MISKRRDTGGPIRRKKIGGDGRPIYYLDPAFDYVVPGDIHLPVHDGHLICRYTDPSPVQSILFLQGDTFDQEAFGKFQKNPSAIVKSRGMRAEIDYAEAYMSIWFKRFEWVVLSPGNHETRAYRSSVGNPAYVDMPWYWPYLGTKFINNEQLIILDMNYRAKVGNTWIEHGDCNKKADGKHPAAGVAESYSDGSNVVFGHTHKNQVHKHTSYSGGRKLITTAYNVGTLCDIRKAEYVSQPNWQPGCAIIKDGGYRVRMVE